MALDYNEIEKAIAEEENAGGFAKLIKRFKQLGIKKYDYYVAEGIYRYYDNEESVDSQMNGTPKSVAQTANSDKIKAAVKQVQSGMIDFEEFCQLAGQAGINYWTSDLKEMTVSYFDRQDSAILIEPIPAI